MKLKIKSNRVIENLRALTSVALRSNSNVIGDYIFIDCSKQDSLYFHTTDFNIHLKYIVDKDNFELELNNEDKKGIFINAVLFQKVCGVANDNFMIEQKGNIIYFRYSDMGVVYKITEVENNFSEDAYNRTNEFNEIYGTFLVPFSHLKKLIDYEMFSINQKNYGNTPNGMCFQLHSPDLLKVISTDSRKLTYISLNNDNKNNQISIKNLKINCEKCCWGWRVGGYFYFVHDILYFKFRGNQIYWIR